MQRVEGRIAPGEKIKVVSEANPGRAFPVKVTAFEPARAMISAWRSSTEPGPTMTRTSRPACIA